MGDLGLFGYFVKCLKNYTNFKGRARRKEYWGFALFYFLFYLVSIAISSILVGTIMFFKYGHVPESVGIVAEGVAWGLQLPWLLPHMAVFVRRMHDIGRSGAWIWLWIATQPCIVLAHKVPSLFWLWILVCISSLLMVFGLRKKGRVGENMYGADPKA
jgi:uncharacterized membrane protein YhaH (DUF805 family)